MWSKILRGLASIAFVFGLAMSGVSWRSTVALIATVGICGMYGLLFKRLRSRRIGSAAVGSFYDMLEKDKRRAIEIIVEEKAEEQMPEDAEGGGPNRRY